MVKEEISEPSQDQKIVQKFATVPMSSNFTSNPNVSEMREELKSEINLEDHIFVPNYGDENHEVPYKKARIKEEKALVKKIGQHKPINEEASNVINSNSKSVFNEKDISKEIKNGHCDIIDQEIDIKTENMNIVDSIYKNSLKKQETEIQELEQIGHCPKERDGPAFRCKYCWNTTIMIGRKKLKENAMTRYFCSDCQVNLCIVPCFQAYHKALEDSKFNSANQNPSNLEDTCDKNLSRKIKKCVVPYCGNKGMKGFFTFPKNAAEQELWKKSCGVSILRQSSRVCHKHFKDSCFVNTDFSNKNRKRGLKKGSKPELLLSQVLLKPKCLEVVKLENFQSDGSNDPLDICDDKLESVHEKENCAEK